VLTALHRHRSALVHSGLAADSPPGSWSRGIDAGVRAAVRSAGAASGLLNPRHFKSIDKRASAAIPASAKSPRALLATAGGEEFSLVVDRPHGAGPELA
jgi:hypothetical protein